MNESNETWNIDKDIDRVLTGMRNAEVPEDLDRRLLLSLDESRTIADAPRATLRLTSWQWASAAACAAAILTALWATHQPHPSTRDAAIHHAASSVSSQQAPSAAPVLSSVQPKNRVPHLRDEVAKVGSQDTPRAESASSAPDPTSDTFAPSQPAPPLPLTAQEELLVRLTHRGDPVELAQLNNEFIANTDRQAAEFQRFFAPSPVKPMKAGEQNNLEPQKASEDQPAAQPIAVPEAEPNNTNGVTAKQTQ